MKIPLDLGWRFTRVDAAAAMHDAYDDHAWEPVDLPHDWALREGHDAVNGQRDEGGSRAAGIGWYRTVFTAPRLPAGGRLRLECDGAYMDSTMWLNGRELGRRPYGYISFAYDLTEHVRPGGNLLAVRLDNSHEPSARWSHPCGLYAPLRLVVSGPRAVARHGVAITTPEVGPHRARVAVATRLDNYDAAVSAVLETTLLDPDGQAVAAVTSPIELPAGGGQVDQELTVAQPRLWDCDHPALYTAVSRLLVDGTAVDEVRTRCGLRSIAWDGATGFSLNGRGLKLRGMAEHITDGPLGGAWDADWLRWKLDLLRSMGVNAVRTAHNPQVPLFYDLCDELGLLVLDEGFDGWGRKAAEDYGARFFAEWWRRDLEEWVVRGISHPCIVLRSVGNETHGAGIADQLVAACHALDPTRLVTSGAAEPERMDVHGLNGACESPAFLAAPPDLGGRPFLATEAPHTWCVRGFYRARTWYRDGAAKSHPIPDLTPA